MTEIELLIDLYKDEENYYLPLQEGFSKFLSRHDNEEAARAIVEGEKREIEIYEKYGGYYSYGFYIAKKI